MATTEYLPASSSEIEGRLRSRLGAEFPDATTPGTPVYDLTRAFSEVLAENNVQANLAIEGASPRSARGAKLDQWARDFGAERRPPTQGEGPVTFSSTLTGDALRAAYRSATIPAGSVLECTLARLELLTDVTFAPEARQAQGSVRIIPGSAARTLTTGTNLRFTSSALAGLVSASISGAFAPGTPAETDEQLSYRLSLIMRAPYALDGYLAAVLGEAGVSDAQVTSGAYGGATIEVFVTPSTAPGSEELRARIAALYKGPARPYVIFPSYEAVAMRIRVQGAAQKKTVTDAVNNIPPGSPLIVSQIEAALLTAGAQDAQVLEISRGLYEEGEVLESYSVGPVNIPAPTSRSRFFTRESYVVFCEG